MTEPQEPQNEITTVADASNGVAAVALDDPVVRSFSCQRSPRASG